VEGVVEVDSIWLYRALCRYDRSQE
jgi:hypothetical protein